MNTKICPRCKLEKNLILFPVTNKKTGKTIYCDSCKKDYDKDWWAKVKGVKSKKKLGLANVNRIRNKKYIIEVLKNNECCDCKIKDWRVLEFDHKDRELKLFSLADSSTYSLDKIKKEIDKCDIVCANCHNIRTIEQRGYYNY